MNFATTTDEQLQAAIDEYNQKRSVHNLAVSELNSRRAAVEQKVAQKNREELLESDKFTKLLPKFKKALGRLDACDVKHNFVVTLPITFRFKTSVDSDTGNNPKLDYVFANQDMTAKIDKISGLSNKQRGLLQEGLDAVVEKACDRIYNLFPDVMKEQKAAFAEYSTVVAEIVGLGLNTEDFLEAI